MVCLGRGSLQDIQSRYLQQTPVTRRYSNARQKSDRKKLLPKSSGEYLYLRVVRWCKRASETGSEVHWYKSVYRSTFINARGVMRAKWPSGRPMGVSWVEVPFLRCISVPLPKNLPICEWANRRALGICADKRHLLDRDTSMGKKLIMSYKIAHRITDWSPFES